MNAWSDRLNAGWIGIAVFIVSRGFLFSRLAKIQARRWVMKLSIAGTTSATDAPIMSSRRLAACCIAALYFFSIRRRCYLHKALFPISEDGRWGRITRTGDAWCRLLTSTRVQGSQHGCKRSLDAVAMKDMHAEVDSTGPDFGAVTDM